MKFILILLCYTTSANGGWVSSTLGNGGVYDSQLACQKARAQVVRVFSSALDGRKAVGLCAAVGP